MFHYSFWKRAERPSDSPRASSLRQLVAAIVFVFLLAAGCNHHGLVGCNHFYPKADWKTNLQYDDGEVKPLYISPTGCPDIEVRLNDKPFHLGFDFGCSKGFQITTAVEEQANYTVLEETNTYHADGTIRGKVSRIKVDSLEVFGDRYEDQEGTLADWRIFSSLPYEGLIGLEYFAGCRFTLDYRRQKLGLTRRPLPDIARESNDCLFIDLLDPPDYHRHGVYVLGQVNSVECVIHIDTGCSVTMVDPAVVTPAQRARVDGGTCSAELPVNLGGFAFAISGFRVDQIRHPSPHRYPVRMGIGSDLLKHLVITVDRTENKNLLIIHK